MEFTGKIIAILQPRGGVSKSGNEWKSQEYVIEDHGQYPRKMCFDVFGADKIEQFNIQCASLLKKQKNRSKLKTEFRPVSFSQYLPAIRMQPICFSSS